MNITPAITREIPELAHELATSFSADPVMTSVLHPSADPYETYKRYFNVMMKELFIPYGRVDVAEDADGIAGVALWVHPFGQPKFAELKMNALLVKALGKSSRSYLSFDHRVNKYRPRFPHWYLGYIAVPEGTRGKGVGGELLDYGLNVADGDPAYLEATSAESRILYERKGFIQLGVLDWGRPSQCYAMWRPANTR